MLVCVQFEPAFGDEDALAFVQAATFVEADTFFAALMGSGVDPYWDDVVLLLQNTGEGNGSISFTDQSITTPHSLTPIGNVQWNASGEIEFDGSGDYIQAADDADWWFDADFTIELFGVKFDTAAVKQGLISQFDSAGNQRAWSIYYDPGTGKLVATGSLGGVSFTFAQATFTPATDGTEYDICYEKAGNTVRLYVDGTKVGSNSMFGSFFDSTQPLRIGRHVDGTNDDFDGKLKAARITKGTARYATDTAYVVPSLPLPTEFGPVQPGLFTEADIFYTPAVIGTGTQALTQSAIFTETDTFFAPTVAGGGAWTPASISGLAAWYDSSDSSNVTLTSSSVDQWDDLSSNANHLTQSTSGNKPTYDTTTNTINSKNVISFDGSDDFLESSLPAGFPADNDTYVTFAAVFRMRNTLSGGMFDFSSSTSTNTTCNFLTEAHVQKVRTTTSGTEATQSTADTTNAHLWSGLIKRDDRQLRLDGGTASTQTTSATASAYNNMRVGRLFQDVLPLLGDYGEAIFFTGNSSTDREKAEGYLAHKWGLAGNLPGGHPYKSAPP
jgi:hypothetical protein